MGLPAGATIPDSYPEARLWNAGTADRELLQRLFPYLDAAAQYWYPDFGACRLEAPLQQFKDRLAQLGADHPYVAQWLLVERAVLSVCQLKSKNSHRRAGAAAAARDGGPGDRAVTDAGPRLSARRHAVLSRRPRRRACGLCRHRLGSGFAEPPARGLYGARDPRRQRRRDAFRPSA